MEPLAHTLAGACLAEAGFKRTTPLATSTLLIAANLPDLDGACYFVGSDMAFAFRRGWTHGVLAMLLLPGLLAYAMMAFDTHVRRKRDPAAKPAQAWPILAASIVGVLSHPFMDWLNNYGVRLLMPFEDRWFYGDALFIADPWLWLFLGAGVMFTWTRTRAGVIAASGLIALTVTVLMSTTMVAAPAKAGWMAGLVLLLTLRWFVPSRHAQRSAQVAVGVAVVYIGLMIAGSRIAERHVRELARARQWDVDRVAAMPVPAQPFRRQVIAVTPQEYLFISANWTQALPLATEPQRASRGAYDPIVAAALEAPSVRGVRNWLRFPSFEVVSRRDGTHRVLIRDARFAVGNRPGFGIVATVDLDARLVPMAAPR